MRREAGRIFICSRYFATVLRAIFTPFSWRAAASLASLRGLAGFSAAINARINSWTAPEATEFSPAPDAAKKLEEVFA